MTSNQAMLEVELVNGSGHTSLTEVNAFKDVPLDDVSFPKTSMSEKSTSVRRGGAMTPPLDTPPPTRSVARSIGIVASCTIAMVVNISSLSSVSIALPTIGQHFNVGPNELQWLLSAYSLSSGCFLILFGRLADLYGRKLAFLLGTVWMLAFSIGCGFAQSNTVLVLLRALQGIGPAATIPAALGILAESFPPGVSRSLAFATFSAGAPLGGAVGYQLGGVMTQLTNPTWRSTFYLTAGLCGGILIASFFVIEADVITESDKRVDWIGAFFVTAGLALLLFVLGDGDQAPKGWKTGWIIALLIISIIFLLTFAAWEIYLEARTTFPPLMKPSIWTRGNGRFAIVQLVAFFEWCGFQAWALWATLYYQDYILLTPILTMIRFLPMFFTGLICNVVVALTIGRIAGHWLLGFGSLVTAIAPLLFAVINTNSSYWAFGFPAAVTSVVGADFVFATGTLYVAKLATPEEQSLAGALFQTLTQIGTAVGLTATTIIHNSIVTRRSRDLGIITDKEQFNAPRSAQLEGYRAAQWGAFAFPVLGGVLTFIFLRGVGVVGQRKDETNSDETRVNSARNSHDMEH